MFGDVKGRARRDEMRKTSSQEASGANLNEIGALTSRAAAIERGGRGWDRPRRARKSRGIVG